MRIHHWVHDEEENAVCYLVRQRRSAWEVGESIQFTLEVGLEIRQMFSRGKTLSDTLSINSPNALPSWLMRQLLGRLS